MFFRVLEKRGKNLLWANAWKTMVTVDLTSTKTQFWTRRKKPLRARVSGNRCNNKTNEINKEKYLNVLLTKQSSAGLNKGFRVVDNTTYAYQQIWDSFAYFYPKRKVLEDGVTTMPLDI